MWEAIQGSVRFAKSDLMPQSKILTPENNASLARAIAKIRKANSKHALRTAFFLLADIKAFAELRYSPQWIQGLSVFMPCLPEFFAALLFGRVRVLFMGGYTCPELII
ncbi:hypothetical protein CFIMG_002949RA [Ceratocystis fimbriata CBS 114723]|uniref:Uncharacterized protein n=1 Tax=Ceratocystis fimbriata CBS 114723 TaxID=1035309 RepID=A0A2C5WV54_9PEZI|nr:hypothetical protein CFIMG_002949RA [Ceratocystis fimbriata CBS 114723]